MAIVKLKNADEYILDNNTKDRIIRLEKGKRVEQEFDPRYINREGLVDGIINDKIDVIDWDWKKFIADKLGGGSRSSVPGGTSHSGSDKAKPVLMVTLGSDRGFWAAKSDPNIILSLMQKNNVLEVDYYKNNNLYNDVLRGISSGQLKIISNPKDGENTFEYQAVSEIAPEFYTKAKRILKEKEVNEIINSIATIDKKFKHSLPIIREMEKMSGKPRENIIGACERKMAEFSMTIEDSINFTKSLKENKIQ